ncbi:hypothetical protein [Mycetocola reblochoni]|nr:hypothetical protein [Mycetocola reblochoni]
MNTVYRLNSNPSSPAITKTINGREYTLMRLAPGNASFGDIGGIAWVTDDGSSQEAPTADELATFGDDSA